MLRPGPVQEKRNQCILLHLCLWEGPQTSEKADVWDLKQALSFGSHGPPVFLLPTLVWLAPAYTPGRLPEPPDQDAYLLGVFVKFCARDPSMLIKTVW